MIIHLVIFLFIYLAGLYIFVAKRKHLLLILLRLEFIVISLFFGLFIFLESIEHEYFFSLVFLTIRVCERALGLSILVLIIRTHGNDFILTLSSLW